jgi:hypothetical protein
METVDWIAAIGGVVSLISLVLPVTRDFLLSHPLWGWVGFIAALGVIPFTGRPGPRTRRREKSVTLINQRLLGWGVDSSNYSYLEGQLDHNRLPVAFVSDFENVIDKWDCDSRVIEDRRLNEAWSNLVRAATAYSSKWDEFLDQSDRVRKNSGGVVTQYFEISPQLKTMGSGKEYRAAASGLASARQALVAELRTMHRLLHKYSD